VKAISARLVGHPQSRSLFLHLNAFVDVLRSFVDSLAAPQLNIAGLPRQEPQRGHGKPMQSRRMNHKLIDSVVTYADSWGLRLYLLSVITNAAKDEIR
jgi:hypothetical protein